MAREITLHDAIQAYKTYLQGKGKNPRTLYTYGKDLEQIEAFFGSDRVLSSILNLHVGKFLKSPELLHLPNGQDRSAATVNKTLRVLRMFLVWALERGMIDQLPLPKNYLMGRTKSS